jgi:hypothetical protein
MTVGRVSLPVPATDQYEPIRRQLVRDAIAETGRSAESIQFTCSSLFIGKSRWSELNEMQQWILIGQIRFDAEGPLEDPDTTDPF